MRGAIYTRMEGQKTFVLQDVKLTYDAAVDAIPTLKKGLEHHRGYRFEMIAVAAPAGYPFASKMTREQIEDHFITLYEYKGTFLRGSGRQTYTGIEEPIFLS